MNSLTRFFVGALAFVSMLLTTFLWTPGISAAPYPIPRNGERVHILADQRLLGLNTIDDASGNIRQVLSTTDFPDTFTIAQITQTKFIFMAANDQFLCSDRNAPFFIAEQVAEPIDPHCLVSFVLSNGQVRIVASNNKYWELVHYAGHNVIEPVGNPGSDPARISFEFIRVA